MLTQLPFAYTSLENQKIVHRNLRGFQTVHLKLNVNNFGNNINEMYGKMQKRI